MGDRADRLVCRGGVDVRASAGRRLPRRPALGVALGPDDRGVAITSVTPGSAAAVNGLRAGDVITGVDGVAVHALPEVIAALVRHRAGEIARFTITRDDRPESHAVTLGTFPRETQPGVTIEYGPVTLRDASRLRTIVSVPTEGATRLPAVMLLQGGACNSIEVPPGAADAGGPGGFMRTLAASGYVTLRVEKSGVGDGDTCSASRVWRSATSPTSRRTTWARCSPPAARAGPNYGSCWRRTRGTGTSPVRS
jgi:membrane-associated protease RseP (regulator of RpoE activity)